MNPSAGKERRNRNQLKLSMKIPTAAIGSINAIIQPARPPLFMARSIETRSCSDPSSSSESPKNAAENINHPKLSQRRFSVGSAYQSRMKQSSPVAATRSSSIDEYQAAPTFS